MNCSHLNSDFGLSVFSFKTKITITENFFPTLQFWFNVNACTAFHTFLRPAFLNWHDTFNFSHFVILFHMAFPNVFFFFFLESILNNMLFLCYCITVSTPTKILFILQPKSESTSLYLKILIFKNPFQIYCCLFYFTSVALHWLPASSILL